MRLVLKNLWARRKQNAWICVELVLVSVVSWFVLDPLFVIVHNTFVASDGYDPDRLCILTTHGRSKEGLPAEETIKSMEVIKTKLKNMKEVESVSLTYERGFPNGDGESVIYYSLPDDTVNRCLSSYFFYHSGEDMYKTLGLKVLSGKPEEEGAVITQSLALALFGKTDVAGATMNEYYNLPSLATPEEVHPFRIAAVVEDIRMEKIMNWKYGVFWERSNLFVSEQSDLLVRLKDGVDAATFCAQIRPTMQKELSSGRLFVCKAVSMQELIDHHLRFQGVTSRIRRYISLAIFFMVNLCLGTIGTFWLQTRKRKEDIGIMRSFGASKGRIFREFLSESFVLTTICHIVGCFLFLQYAYSYGLSTGIAIDEELLPYLRTGDSWLNHFAPHFLAVGIFIYLIILLTVSIGIAIPAWNIVRTKPVEALREE